MIEVKLVTRKIKGQDVDIFATENGTFTAAVNGEKVEKPTIQSLVDRVGVLLAVKRTPVDVSMLDRPGWHEKKRSAKFKTVKLTGIHSSNGNMLINTGTVTQQLSHRDSLYVLLTEQQQEEYFQLNNASLDAAKAVQDWEKKYALTPVKAGKLLGIHPNKKVKE